MLEKGAITIGRVARYRNLAVAPVYATDEFAEEVAMLNKVIGNKRFSVKESGEVGTLIINNNLDDQVFIACGTLIEGISQNRYSRYPSLIMPHTASIMLPVNCAQQGQGLVGGIRGRYNVTDTIVMPSIRSGEVNQHDAWSQIENTTVILGRMDPTRDYAYAEKRADIKDFIEAMGGPKEGQVGIVAGIRDRDRTLYYTDFFGNNRILRELHPKLTKSFGIVARVREGNADEVEKDDIVSFLRQVTVANGHRKDHVGGGELYILDSPVQGSILAYENSTVQVSMRQD